jgi:hypothetical protein
MGRRENDEKTVIEDTGVMSGRWIFLREKIDGTIKLSVHFHILPRLRMLRTIVYVLG